MAISEECHKFASCVNYLECVVAKGYLRLQRIECREADAPGLHLIARLQRSEPSREMLMDQKF